ncbi:MAG TPA: hypothetical protein VGX46_19070, partial [Vicinamibacterales bacterium]|nr:hypothetical protein [Vicinamibacterales bacterium]
RGDLFRLRPLLHADKTASRRTTIVLPGLWPAGGVANVEAGDAWQVQAEAGVNAITSGEHDQIEESRRRSNARR